MRRGVWLAPDVVPEPAALAASGIEAFGCDLLRLTPAVIEEATSTGLALWSYWSAGPFDDGRQAGISATDVALTLRQPTSTSICFLLLTTGAPAGGATTHGPADADYFLKVRKVCEARGFHSWSLSPVPPWPELDTPAVPGALWDAAGPIDAPALPETPSVRETLVTSLQLLLTARDKLAAAEFPDYEVAEAIRTITRRLEAGV